MKTMQYTLVTCCLLMLLFGCQNLTQYNFVNQAQYNQQLIAKVKDAFQENESLASNNILVDAAKGTVYLSGYVKTIRQSDTAQIVASQVQGVKQVENNIIVRK